MKLVSLFFKVKSILLHRDVTFAVSRRSNCDIATSQNTGIRETPILGWQQAYTYNPATRRSSSI